MARLNTRPSYFRSSRLSTITPDPIDSDRENQDPSPSSRRPKGKQKTASPAQSRNSLPTPLSDRSMTHNDDEQSSDSTTHGQKRRRLDRSNPQREAQYSDEEEAKFNRYFDPNQDPEWRREVKKQTRLLDRRFHENRDELLRNTGDGLRETINKANEIFREVKQTGDATIDSRLLVNVSDLGFKKSAQLVLGDNSTGVDVDEFLTKCLTYMDNGGPLGRDLQDTSTRSRPSGTQQRRQLTQRGGDDDSDGAELNDFSEVNLDWEFLGRNACFPYNARPPVPSFLLGPLSVEKKVRTQTQRRARQPRDNGGAEARPEDIGREDIQQSNENGLTQTCARIRKHLSRHCMEAEKHLGRRGITSMDELRTDRGKQILKEAKVTDTGGPSLFEYVVNPHSFGQTVENIFYISFLIKEGAVGITPDSDGLPSLGVTNTEALEQEGARRHERQKNQAVFALDFELWKQLIKAYDIKEPMIPHRQDEQTSDLGARGWYG
ncbi:Nse4-domain-containing protein [Polychaeton citri CBS 116435]|uniref:Non-structural maintenance of chromosomes element 4 n=1 Tax=Polychaeton citri CBS 116435 TaxID=1314669 RepID=A0A9P4UQC4_9PEZI|nr:Nse4-domain-containing protein [Polychaeton citri CBS 116435]